MPIVRLTRADAALLEGDESIPRELRVKIANMLARTERNIIIVVDRAVQKIVQERLNPHLRNLALVLMLLGTLLTFGQQASAHANQCSVWATMAGKEGRVGDSLHMHLLGCDDGPWVTKHYDASGQYGARVARAIVRSNPGYFVYRPWTVAALVKQQTGCRAFEDGSYTC